MAGRSNLDEIGIFTNPDRIRILNLLIKKPYTITEIEKDLNINRGTLKHHLKILHENKLIKREKQSGKSGSPVLIKKNFQTIESIIKKFPKQQSFLIGLIKSQLDIK